MSEKGVLVSVEDLINLAFGTLKENRVDMKAVETVLHILARQMRVLEQLVEIRVDELEEVADQGQLNPAQKKALAAAAQKAEKGLAKAKKEMGKKDKGNKDEPIKSADDKSGYKDKSGYIDKSAASVKKGSIKSGEIALNDSTRNADDGAELVESKSDINFNKKNKGKVSYSKENRAIDDNDADKDASKIGTNMDLFHEAGGPEKGPAPAVGGGGGGSAGMTSDAKERYKTSDKKIAADVIEPYEPLKKEDAGGKRRISVTERRDGDDKILVVDHQTLLSGRPSKTGIEVITRPQFRQLEKAVVQLQNFVTPPEPLSLPPNAKLVEDVLAGQATLAGTMSTMQINARVQAAEEAVSRMAEILTRLAAMGTLPPELARQLPDTKTLSLPILDMLPGYSAPSLHSTRPSSAATSHKASATYGPGGTLGKGGMDTLESQRAGTGTPLSTLTEHNPDATITHEEMEISFLAAREDVMKELSNTMAKALQNADYAVFTAKTAADKMEISANLNKRLNNLFSMVADYSEQLSGFDAGIATQMKGFQEQMAQMRHDLQVGLSQLESINTNVESAAIVELTERYQTLVSDLETGLNAHQTLLGTQNSLAQELRKLIASVEILRDQKADRDEVWDGLRDKADISRLDGLLSQEEYMRNQHALEDRLDQCHNKFQKQEATWIRALADMRVDLELKADLVGLLADRETLQKQLDNLLAKTRTLEERLGDPLAAILTRAISRGSRCGACQVPAMMKPQEQPYKQPLKLPAFTRTKVDEVCSTTPVLDERHACQRWAGGSHTLINEAVSRERKTSAEIDESAPPDKRYLGYGNDGRLYKLAEEYLPCAECQPLGAVEVKVIKQWKRKPKKQSRFAQKYPRVGEKPDEDSEKDEEKIQEGDDADFQTGDGGGDRVPEVVQPESEDVPKQQRVPSRSQGPSMAEPPQTDESKQRGPLLIDSAKTDAEETQDRAVTDWMNSENQMDAVSRKVNVEENIADINRDADKAMF